MNAQQLRNSILQEAIEGRLVPQDPNDEPASALLERIREEKRRLVKEGKLKKKDLVETPISEDEKPFEIPESWEWVRLKYIVSLLGDGIHGTPEYDVLGNYYFINGNNLSNNKIVIKGDTKRVNEIEYQKYKKNLSDKTILVSINGTIGNVGHYNGEHVILGKSACYFNLIDIGLKPYITMLMYTDFFLNYAKENATGSTIKNVSLAVMNDFVLPLPPLAEQHRIVAKIEELMPKVEEYGMAQEALDKLNAELPEKLKKSILQEAIEGRLVPQDPNDEPASVLLDKIRKEKAQLVKEGKLKKKDLVETPISEDEIPFEIPESWEWVRLKYFLQFINGDRGKNYPSKDKLMEKGDIPFISAINISRDSISKNGLLFLSQKQFDALSQGKLIKGDLVLCIRGSLGKIAIYPYERGAIASSLVILRKIGEILVKYVLLFLKSNSFYCQINNKDNGTAQPNLSADSVSNFLFPLPPLAEQHRIVERIEKLMGGIEML